MSKWQDYIQHISVSQIRTHDRNPRCWAIQKLLKIPTPSSPAAEFGRKVHDMLEQYLTNGEVSSQGELVDKCLEHFCTYWKGAGMRGTIGVEMEFKEEFWPGLPPLLGYIDWVGTNDDNEIVVIDHKTSRTRRYFLKEEELIHDIQMMVYAAVLLRSYPEEQGIWLQQCQFAYSNKRDVLGVVKLWVNRSDVEVFMEDLSHQVRDGIVKTIEQYDMAGLGMVPAKCQQCNNAFGPNSCPFHPMCCGQESLADCKKRLTKKDESAIIKVDNKAEDHQMGCECKTINTLELVDIMNKAREKFKGIGNVWDRRDSMTEAIVQHVVKSAPDFLVLPSHMRDRISPDYEPVVTRLKELGFVIYLEV